MSAPTIAELEARLAAVTADGSDPIARVDAMVEYAWAIRNDDVERANALAAEAKTLAVEHDYTLGMARATRTLAMTIRDPQNLQRLFRLAHEAQVLFDDAGDDVGRAASRDFLSSIYEHVGDLNGALELGLDALSIARAAGDAARQGYALSSVGGILAASGETEAGVAHLEEALRLFEELGDLNGVGTICGRLSRILQETGETEAALDHARRCDEVTDATGNDFFGLTAMSVMGDIAQERGELEEAERLYRAALERVADEQTRIIVGATTRVSLGRCLMRQGAMEAAGAVLNETLAQVSAPVSIVHRALTHEALADLHEAREDFAGALQHLRDAAKLRERIAQQDARNRTAQLEARVEMETAKKDAEIQRLRFVELHGMQAKLVEAEKMGLLGKLAAGTAHELHTPLGVLRSNAKLVAKATDRLRELLDDDDDVAQPVERLASVIDSCRAGNDEALARLAAIADGFGRFAELDQAERRSFDVKVGLEGALAILTPTIGDGVEVQRHFEAVPPIDGWPREVNLALLTVLQNAAEAIEATGVIAVSVTAVDDQVHIRIRDDGRGMTEEQVAHLFDVGWSEEGERVKMRLGLSAAYATMQKHGGAIDVDSEPGEGTTVTLRFPSA